MKNVWILTFASLISLTASANVFSELNRDLSSNAPASKPCVEAIRDVAGANVSFSALIVGLKEAQAALQDPNTQIEGLSKKEKKKMLIKVEESIAEPTRQLGMINAAFQKQCLLEGTVIHEEKTVTCAEGYPFLLTSLATVGAHLFEGLKQLEALEKTGTAVPEGAREASIAGMKKYGVSLADRFALSCVKTDAQMN